ncbi:MAG TPA: hypothetical protein VJU78_18950 [Chitinophagaceae bacterium]|nr:hypothetical protein [Chitinophagaceae bacterium]
MRLLIIPCVAFVILAWTFSACKSSSAPPFFCDTSCLKDSIKFVKEDHPYKPYVYISAANCIADTLTWSYIDMGVNRKMGIPDLVGTTVRLNKDNVSCFIKDTSYAWLVFNDCSNGRGYLLKIPFNKKADLGRKSSALNKFDPKFSVAEGLIAYSDRGNIFVEDMATGKTAMMTFGAKVDIDYDAIHKTVDSVNITPTRIWAKVLLDKEWKTFEKNITLK